MIVTVPSLGAIVRINMHGFWVVLASVAAWAIWPNTLTGWGWGFIAIILWCSAFASLIQGLREMTQLYLRDKAIAAITAHSSAAKSDSLASQDDLRRRGLIDG